MEGTPGSPIAAGKRVYIIAGEASGDLHGGNLVKELKALDPSMKVRAWGGDRMQAAGAEVVKHYRDLAFMGFAEVIRNLRTILRNLQDCKEDIERFRPDAIVLIDYPGFNLRIAEHAHKLGIPVHYYISPQVWAWKPGRVRSIARTVDHMHVILPFEKDWYAEKGMEVDFVGHPLLDELPIDPGKERIPDRIALLPGSRRQEIASMLPLMLKMVPRFPDHRFVVAAAPSVPDEVYAQLIGNSPVEVVKGRTYEVLATAHAALVTSGTATLEAALLGVPLVICYRGSALNVWLARRLVNIKFIGLANLIMGREVVTELIQSDLNEERLEKELRALIGNGDRRNAILKDLEQLRQRLGGPGASRKVAMAVWKTLQRSAGSALTTR